MKHVIRKVLLVAFGLIYTASLFAIARGEWESTHTTNANYSQVISSNPGNSELWTEYAGILLNGPGSSDSRAAVNAYRQAIFLNPLNPANWDGLASAHLKTWDAAEAEAALRGWLVAIPHSPDAAWRLGNFLIFQDRVKEAFPYLREAGRASWKLRAPLFDLAWKILADPGEILSELIPSDPTVREEYLSFLLQTKRAADAREVWREVRGYQDRHVLELGHFYVDVLRDAGMGAEAANVWEEVLGDSGRTGAKPPGEMMTNGDFEAGLPNTGLDWLLAPQPGFKIALDDTTAQNGAHSLRVTFDGLSNPEFYHVRQDVPVEPDRDYRFSGYIKTEDITSDNGVRFELAFRDPPPGRALALQTENRVGTNPWTLEQIDFRTGPATHFVEVRLRRYRSSKLIGLIQGTVWIDNLSLKPRP